MRMTLLALCKPQDEKCALAYSKVQVECDVCRACSIQDRVQVECDVNGIRFCAVEEAGCSVHAAASDPFDCAAALNNFFRATRCIWRSCKGSPARP